MVDALVLVVELQLEYDVNVLGLVFDAKELVSDLIADRPLLRPVQVQVILHKAIAIVYEHEILSQLEVVISCWVLEVVFIEQWVQRWMELGLWLFGDLDLDVVFLVVAGGDDVAVEN